jgi:CrcB protein
VSGPTWIAFIVAAAAGAVARYRIDGLVQDRAAGVFPWGTLVVNVGGCFVLGLVTGLGLYRDLGSTTQTVLGTGGLGAYTTFSTYTFETVQLAEQGAFGAAARNVAANLVVGLAAAAAGLAIAAAL